MTCIFPLDLATIRRLRGCACRSDVQDLSGDCGIAGGLEDPALTSETPREERKEGMEREKDRTAREEEVSQSMIETARAAF